MKRPIKSENVLAGKTLKLQCDSKHGSSWEIHLKKESHMFNTQQNRRQKQFRDKQRVLFVTELDLSPAFLVPDAKIPLKIIINICMKSFTER